MPNGAPTTSHGQTTRPSHPVGARLYGELDAPLQALHVQRAIGVKGGYRDGEDAAELSLCHLVLRAGLSLASTPEYTASGGLATG
mgnify:CR=1 FL=1